MPSAEQVIQRKAKSISANRMMAVTMIRMGMPREDIIAKAGITKATFNDLHHQYTESNLEAVSTELIDTWEMLLRAKLMETSEKALDVVLMDLDERDTRSAKNAADVFSTIFNSFRLSTGKSTENISSATVRFNEIIESRRKLEPPNKSAEEDVITVQ